MSVCSGTRYGGYFSRWIILILNKMYGSKDKLSLFRKLQRVDKAGCDLRLLSDQAPSFPELEKFQRNPSRYADDILYALLDVATEQLIRDNRLLDEHIQETSQQVPDKEQPAGKQQEKANPDITEGKKKLSRKKTNILGYIGRIFLT